MGQANARKTILGVVLLLGSVLSSHAVSLLISNPSFEADVVGNGLESSVATGWTISGDAGTHDPNFASYGVVLPDGDQVGFARIGAGGASASLTNSLADTLAAGLYTLSVYVGDRIPPTPVLPSFSVALYAGGTLLGSASTPPPSNSGFTNVVVTYSATGSDPALGQPLRIVLSGDTGAEGAVVDFDNISLDFFTNPEPSTAALLLLGGAILSRRFRRR